MRRQVGGAVLYEIKDVASAVGLAYSTVWCRVYLSETLPPPSVRLGRRMLYTAKEYTDILEYYGVNSTASA
jgi:hypothetical protein